MSKSTYEMTCEGCDERLEDCACDPDFPYVVFCPMTAYDPDRHTDPKNPLDPCPFCNPSHADFPTVGGLSVHRLKKV